MEIDCSRASQSWKALGLLVLMAGVEFGKENLAEVPADKQGTDKQVAALSIACNLASLAQLLPLKEKEVQKRVLLGLFVVLAGVDLGQRNVAKVPDGNWGTD